jgi:hypothetical protein
MHGQDPGAGQRARALAGGQLNGNDFVTGAASTQAVPPFLGDSTNGLPAFDADGTEGTAAVNLVTLVGPPAITTTDLIVIGA